MSEALARELDAALRAAEGSFQVGLIGTFLPDLVCAPPEAEASTWLAQNHPNFDQFPVRDGDTTVGLLLREMHGSGNSVREAMVPLRDGVVVSADMPIAELIPSLEGSHSRLVLRGNRIDGLVTQSDLLKLPVRMLVFGLVNHLELLLRERVRRSFFGEDWIDRLEANRRRDLRADLRRLQEARLDPDPLEVTNLSDLEVMLGGDKAMGEGFGESLRGIRTLRNQIAHAKTYISSVQDVRSFVGRFVAVRHWISEITKVLVETR